MRFYRVIAPQVLAVHHIDNVFAGLSVGMSGVQHASLGLYTGRTHQFVAYFDADRELCVAGRSLGDADWTRVCLPEKLDWDSHNYLALALDAGGHIHLCGNMHGGPLCYFRSTRPYELASLTRVMDMTGQDEQLVTYPRFLHDAQGVLYFTYRQGVSGAGSQFYNVYDYKRGIWKRLHKSPLTDGEGLRNAYFEGPVLGPDTRFHLCWMWRDTADALTNHSLCYACSRDLRNWETSRGRLLRLPITPTSAEVVDPVEPGGGLINGDHRIGFDTQGRTIISYHKYDEEGNSQLYQARLENGGWVIYKTTAWSYRWDFGGLGSLPFEITFGPVMVDNHGRLTQWYRHVGYGNGTFVLDEDSLRPVGVAEGSYDLPAGLMLPESSFPGMQVNWSTDSGHGPEDGSQYMLRWEALPANRDQPREGPLPEPTPLRLYKLAPGSIEELDGEASDSVARADVVPYLDAIGGEDSGKDPNVGEGSARNLASKLGAQKARADTLTNKLIAQLSTRKVLEQSLEESERSLNSLQQEVAERNGQLADLNARVEELAHSVTQRDEHIRNLHNTVGRRDEQIGQLQDTIADRDKRISTFDERMDQSKMQVAELVSCVENLKQTVSSTKAELETRTRERQRLREEGGKLRKRVERLETQLTEVYSSHSWRLTGPMRLLSHALRFGLLLRNAKRCLKLISWLATGQFRRAASALLPYYMSLVPDRLKAFVPHALSAAVRRLLPPEERSTVINDCQTVIRPVSADDVTEKAWWWSFKPTACGDTGKGQAETARSTRMWSAVARLARAEYPPVVVIPVFNAPAETERCITSVLKNTEAKCRIIVVDDASSDPSVRHLLDRYGQSPRIEVHRNEKNLGFSETANRGIELAGSSDVVLLNSDTVVPPRWLRNLQLAAYSDDKVGTATALSDNAGAFSVPEVNKTNPIPYGLSSEGYARAISQVSVRSYPATPTGNAFCMYIRRDCLDETGLLDVEAFPRGYGEENDFCMRAARLGWTHVVDDATLVRHVNALSFGKKAKHELMARGRAVLDERYPEYTQAVREFLQSEQMKLVRRRIGAVSSVIRRRKLTVKPRVLYVLSTLTGGTPHTNQDLMLAVHEHLETLVLTCNARQLRLMHFHEGKYVGLESHELSERISPIPHRSKEYDAVVAQWIVDYAVELIHVRHIGWHSLGLMSLAKQLGVPVVFSFHDCYAICPTVTLLDEHYVHCKGQCTPSRGDCVPDLWRPEELPSLKHSGIYEWRTQMGRALEDCDAFVTTSKRSKELLINTFPFMTSRPFFVIPHGRDFLELGGEAARPDSEKPLRILVPGNVREAKGSLIIAELAQQATSKGFELHLLGRTPLSLRRFGGKPGIVFHGEYSRNEFSEKVRMIQPHVGAIFSIFPETHCHTLTELWASGIPVIGFDLGAVGERIRETGGGWLAPTANTAGVLNIIEALKADPAEQNRKTLAVHAWQRGPAVLNSCEKMAREYLSVYRMALPGWDGTPKPASDGEQRMRQGSLVEGIVSSLKQHVRQTHCSDKLRSFADQRTVRDRSKPGPAGWDASVRKEYTVAVLAWDVCHNPLGRAYMVAEVLSRRFRVVLLGPAFSRFGGRVWNPLEGARIPVVPLPGLDFPEFGEMLETVAERLGADAVVACKPRLPSLLLGHLIKHKRNRPLFVDIDDFELAFTEAGTPVGLKDIASASKAERSAPHSDLWTRFSENLLRGVDGIFVSNAELQAKYGGLVVPHARDEQLFDPAKHDRQAMRTRLGFSNDDRIVLFAGTPREHKGVMQTLEATMAIRDRRVKMMLVGQPDKPFERQLKKLGRERLFLAGNRPFHELPRFLACADAVCLMQDQSKTVSSYQLPAKVVDALAFGLPVLATPVAPLRPLFDKKLIAASSEHTLTDDLRRVLLSGEQNAQDARSKRRSFFLDNMSYDAVLPLFERSIMEAAQQPVPPDATALQAKQIAMCTTTVRGDEAEDSADTNRFDIVLVWRLNDFFLYGRRPEMIVRYLARRREIRRILVVEPPISVKELQKWSEESVAHQQRALYVESLRKAWGIYDSPKVRMHCFVYSDDPVSSGAWPWPALDDYISSLSSFMRQNGVNPCNASFLVYPVSRTMFIPEILRHFKPRHVVADVVDDVRAEPTLSRRRRAELTTCYQEVLGLSSFVITNCSPLKEAMREFHHDVRVLPNGCDLEIDERVSGSLRLEEISLLPRPIIGYVGNLDVRIDAGLLHQIALERPEWQIVLVGSRHTGALPQTLAGLPNVHLPGVVPYEEAKHWIRSFDVALIPHKNTELTRYMNPLKLYLYLAMGVPVVTTSVENLGELAHHVVVAEGTAATIEAIEQCLRLDRSDMRASIQEDLLRHSWERRIDTLLRWLTEQRLKE